MSVTRTEDRQTLALSVHPDGEVTVVAPKGERLSRIVKAVAGKSEWIIQQQEYFRQIHRTWPRRFVSGESYFYLGRQFRLKVTRSRRVNQPAAVQMAAGKLNVLVPKEVDSNVQADFVRAQMVDWYRERTHSQLSQVVNRFCDTLGVGEPVIRVRDFSRRWGSAQPAARGSCGTLTFNWRIVMGPRRLIEYVAAHEACHLIHNDHSQEFWRLLARAMPDCEERRIELAIEGAKFQL